MTRNGPKPVFSDSGSLVVVGLEFCSVLAFLLSPVDDGEDDISDSVSRAEPELFGMRIDEDMDPGDGERVRLFLFVPPAINLSNNSMS